jgi:UDP-N-acetyl-D-glucosamine dehydrogenase
LHREAPFSGNPEAKIVLGVACSPGIPKCMKIAVVGLGYVGLPLALQFCRSNVEVMGLDVDAAKISAITAGRSYIRHIPSTLVAEAVNQGTFTASTEFARVREADAIIICVPTPLNKNREPDISFVLNTGRAIGPHLQRGQLVSLESTSYPGTTDTDLRAVLEEGSGLRAGVDFHLAFSPEREDPGNPDSDVAKLPKIVGGYTPECGKKAEALYQLAVQTIVPVSNCRAAEAAKLLENIFRSVNIALVNELKLVYASMGIDIWEVINAAKTKPFGFMAFYPGPGIGGHCIPVDPFYLTWKAREFGHSTRFIELAGEVNESMPAYVVQRVAAALNSNRKAVNGSRVLVLGLAYKPDVDDIRETPSFHIMNLLRAQGAEVAYHDPYVPVIPPTRENVTWTGLKSTPLDKDNLARMDAVVIATAHKGVDYGQIIEMSCCVVDTRNAVRKHLGSIPEPITGKLWQA